MAINVLQNKQGGPGGGTRRLHHFSPKRRPSWPATEFGLKDWGRNRIDACGKGSIFVRYGTRRYRAIVVVANDNTAPVAIAA